MTKIIGISGRKQSGKNTVANIISGDILFSLGMVNEYGVNDSGNLVIKTKDRNGNSGWGIFDLLRKDEDFISYADANIWPYVKIYHFADYLKRICVDLFDLTEKQVYGTDDDKNTNTPYDMTAREFLQYFGTEVMRKIKDTIWVDVTIKTILKEQSSVSIIPDVRFPNEVEAIHNAGGIVIRLNRDMLHSKHECESALDEDVYSWDVFDHVIDNSNCSVQELKGKILSIKSSWSN